MDRASDTHYLQLGIVKWEVYSTQYTDAVYGGSRQLRPQQETMIGSLKYNYQVFCGGSTGWRLINC